MDDLVGVNIKGYREKLAWTQEHLAEASGVNVRTIQRGEEGHRLSDESLKSIAAAFDIGVDDLRKAPKESEEITSRYKFIPIHKIERAADLRHLMGPDAFQFDYTGTTDPEHEQAIAEFHQELHDSGQCWGDLEPLQRHEALAALENHVTRLHELGLVIGVSTEDLRMRPQQEGIQPFTMQILRVLVSTAAEPKLFLMRDKTEPVRFE